MEELTMNQWKLSHRIVFIADMNGWFVVRGSSDVPVSGRFDKSYLAEAWLKVRTSEA
jgi:hypothetical protein